MDRLPLKTAVAMGGSAGAFRTILRQLDRLFTWDHSALFIVYHRGTSEGIDLGQLVPDDVAFEVRRAHTGTGIEPNVAYYPHDGHDMEIHAYELVCEASHTPPRPKIDVLFSSLAETYGPRAIAVLLSGTGRDGVAGLDDVRQAGGMAIAQDPDKAQFGDLPRAAIEAGAAEHTLTTQEILTLVDDALAGGDVRAR